MADYYAPPTKGAESIKQCCNPSVSQSVRLFACLFHAGQNGVF